MGLETVDLRCTLACCWENRGRKAAYLDGLGIELQPFFLVGEEFLHILALVSLELDHLSHLGVVDNGAIASYHPRVSICPTAGQSSWSKLTELLLDDLEDLLLVELLGQSLNRSQSLTTIALCDQKCVSSLSR